MASSVLDASALLALLQGEPGAEAVAAIAGDAVVTSVNLAEVLGKLLEFGQPKDAALRAIGQTAVQIVAFDASMAIDAGEMIPAARRAGLSLGDVACIAAARHLGLPAYTGDRSWTRHDFGVEIRLIR
jgi:PIN domain nuclease of toxin-antitoxin system